MEPFYLIVLGIAIIIFILVLTFIGLLMQTGKTNMVYPPISNTCPDYWNIDGSNCVIPPGAASATAMTGTTAAIAVGDYNGVGNTGRFNNLSNLIQKLNVPKSSGTVVGTTVFSPSDPAWTSGGLTALCAQNKWANQNNILWDGVSNYNSC